MHQLKCMRCGILHADDWRSCPMVKAFEVNAFGKLTRIEFMTPQDFASKSPVDEPEQPYQKLPSSQE